MLRPATGRPCSRLVSPAMPTCCRPTRTQLTDEPTHLTSRPSPVTICAMLGAPKLSDCVGGPSRATAGREMIKLTTAGLGSCSTFGHCSRSQLGRAAASSRRARFQSGSLGPQRTARRATCCFWPAWLCSRRVGKNNEGRHRWHRQAGRRHLSGWRPVRRLRPAGGAAKRAEHTLESIWRAGVQFVTRMMIIINS